MAFSETKSGSEFSRVMKSSYETELEQMASHFELVTQIFL